MNISSALICCFTFFASAAYAQDAFDRKPIRNLTPNEAAQLAPAAPPETIPLAEAIKQKPLKFIDVQELPPVGAKRKATGADEIEEDGEPAKDPNSVAVDEYFVPTALEHVELRGIRKLTGRAETVAGDIGDVLRFADLEIVPHKCSSVLDQGQRGYAALVEIKEASISETEGHLFRGWLFSTSPSLSSIGHPQYDLLLQSCGKKKEEAAAKEAEKKS